MRNNFPRYTLRTSPEILYKVGYIANFEGRTKNKEIEFILKKHIDEFERQYGEIPLPENIEEE